MSTSPGDENYIRVAIVMSALGTIEYECIHWYTPEVGVDGDDGQNVIDDFMDNLDVALRDLITAVLPTTCQYVGVRGVLHVGERFFTASDNTGANDGDIAGDFQPPQVSVVLAKNAAVDGRQGHGRFFWPLVPEAFTTGYRLNATGRDAYELLAVGLLADVMGAGSNFLAAHFARHAGFLYELLSVRPQLVLKRQGRRELVPLFQ